MDSIWSALAVATRVRTRTLDAATGDATEIDGRVKVSVDGDALRFEERCVLTTHEGRTLDTRNTIVWTRRDGAIEVSHERFGPARAVALVRLVPDGDALRSAADHICAGDRYACAVRCNDGAVGVEWTIIGPRKRILVATVYS
ncbi:MAG: DUF6314 family protein [Phycisphaerales bacterium]